ncbi:MAG: nucleotidyltransferase family protein [Candidatus Zixiibacteriota bacterium]|nr:MAG: nucleotidyltransferase family protein [candidate division Zixibacteria bacterium]
MHAVVLAGGQGTRLAPYTATLPKPLVPVGDKPIIEILLRRLHRGGVRTVRLAVNHLAHLIEAVVGDGSRFGLTITYEQEDKPLSTVGPIARMVDLPEHFIVANGDILTDLDVSDLYRFHLANKAAVTIATHQRRERSDYGVLEVDDKQRVVGFQEKPERTMLVSMGIYVFSRTVLDMVPKGSAYGFDDLMRDLLGQRQNIVSFPYDGYWLDIGRPDDYARAQQDIKEHPELFA